MQYRLTTKGKIVLALLLILVVVSTASVVSMVRPHNQPEEHFASTDEKQEEQESVSSSAGDSTNQDDVKQERTDSNDESVESSIEESAKPEVSVDSEMTSKLKDASARIYFKPDKFELMDSEIVKLDKMIEIAQVYPDQMIIIEGNINGYPQYDDTEFGMTLSDKRAEIVKAYLKEHGLQDDQLFIFSMGSQKPIENTSNLTDCWKNRRTDVYFKDYNGLEY